MFKFASEKIESEALKQSLADVKAGAIVTFEGIVRNHNEGQDVTSLEYEAYEMLGQTEAELILDEAQKRYPILKALCVHRTGVLQVGDMAVFVAVTSAHRDEAFQACRFIIDEIKERLPIWKKETYMGGESSWVNCSHRKQPEKQPQSQLERHHAH